MTDFTSSEPCTHRLSGRSLQRQNEPDEVGPHLKLARLLGGCEP